MEAKDTEGLGFIFLDDKGELWTNQAGGYACRHPEARGLFSPIPKAKEIEAVLESYFTGDQWGGWCDKGIGMETVHAVDACLDALRWTGHCGGEYKVDRTRMQESMEAWIYLVGPQAAVLVWNNSD